MASLMSSVFVALGLILVFVFVVNWLSMQKCIGMLVSHWKGWGAGFVLALFARLLHVCSVMLQGISQ